MVDYQPPIPKSIRFPRNTLEIVFNVSICVMQMLFWFPQFTKSTSRFS